jgi:LacI family transcriptional regulator
MGVTLKTVAAEAGVSLQTVWRAIHDAPDIMPSTRAHVLAVSARLGYRRNGIAGSLRSRESKTIGLVVLDVSNPFTSELTRGVEEEASRQGYSILLMNSGDDVGRERAAVAALMERRVDGLILNPSSAGDHTYLLDDLGPGYPLVAINRQIPRVAATTIASRARDIAEAVAYLAAQGHARIGGIFGNFSNTPFRDRHRHLVAALERHGLAAEGGWLQAGDNSVAFGRAAMRRLLALDVAPTAVVAAGNRLTEGALLGLRDCGKRHGRDLALVGFDLRYAELLDPPLPVLRQPAHAMGEAAVRAILAMLRSGTTGASVRPLPIGLVTPA